MIRDYNKYYGCVLSFILERIQQPLLFRKIEVDAQGFFLFQNQVPIYIKYSKSRKGPWIFNFQDEHIASLQAVINNYGVAIVAFVCGSDGIVGVTGAEILGIIGLDYREQEAVSIRRKLRKMYSVKANQRELDGKVGRDSLIDLLAQYIA